jgi:hypothetical protein
MDGQRSSVDADTERGKHMDWNTFAETARAQLPVDSKARATLRFLKNSYNTLRWRINHDAPLISESAEIARLRDIASRSSHPAQSPGGHRVLIFGVRSWRLHRAWEGLVGRALLDRGASPVVLICSGLPRCDMYKTDTPSDSANICRNCRTTTRQLYHFFGLPFIESSSYLSSSDYSEAADLVDGYAGELVDFAAEGLPYGELVLPSVLRTLRRGTLEFGDDEKRVYRDYLRSGIVVGRLLKRVFGEIQPETLVMLNGMFFAERIAFELAKARGIHVVTHERGFTKNSVVFAHDVPASRYQVDGAWSSIKDKPLTAKEQADLDDFLLSWQTGQSGVINYWPSVEERKESIGRMLSLDMNRTIVTAFSNIIWDTAVYGRDIAFDGLFDWLETTVEIAGSVPDVQFVIRIHPAEVRLPLSTRERALDHLSEKYPSLPDNVFIIPAESDISSYALLDLSQAALVYTSTIGLEAVLRGVPSIVSGFTHYRGKGFTIDCASREDYASLLQSVTELDGVSAEIVAKARRYAHLFFVKNMLQGELIQEMDGGRLRFHFESFDALAEGNSAQLDRICRAILERTEFAIDDLE